MAFAPPSVLTDRFKAAQRHYKRKDPLYALFLLSDLIAQVDADPAAYTRWVELLIQIAEDPRVPSSLPDGSARTLGADALLRLAFRARLYLGDATALAKLAADRRLADRFPIEHALFLSACADRLPPPIIAHQKKAAEVFLAQHRPVRAAAALLKANDRPAAVRCYEQLLSARPAPGRPPLGPYERALVHYQLSVLLMFGYDADSDLFVLRDYRNTPEVHRHSVAAQGILEQLADDFEAQEQPERAIDVYCILIALGRALGRFENVAEGFVGCLRLLKQERLINATLHAYEDFLSACREKDRELALGAQQAREAAEFLDRCGLPWGDPYRQRAADLFEQAAHDPRLDPSRRESLLLSALSLWNALGDVPRAYAVLRQLGQPPAPRQGTGQPEYAPPTLAATDGQERRDRYRTLAAEYERALGLSPADPQATAAYPDEQTPPRDPAATHAASHAASLNDPPPSLPNLSDRSGDLPVWDLDLREWEDDGDPALIATALLCDLQRPAVTRRHALRIGLLYDLAGPLSPTPDPVQARHALVEALAGLHTYEALRPLERIFAAASAGLASAGGSGPGQPSPVSAGVAAAVDPPLYPATVAAILRAPQPLTAASPPQTAATAGQKTAPSAKSASPAPSSTKGAAVDPAAIAVDTPPSVRDGAAPDPTAPAVDTTPTPAFALAELRRRLIRALPRLPYRRALQLVLRGLCDPDLGVFAASLEALGQGRYIGSVSLLSRLLQDPSSLGRGRPHIPVERRLDVQRVALLALSRTRDLRAYGVLLDTYRSRPEPLRSEAFHLLRSALSTDANTVHPLLLQATASHTPESQALRTLIGS